LSSPGVTYAKIKWNIVWGILITFAFFILLFVRLEFFPINTQPVVSSDQIIRSPKPQDTWMNIYQNGRKIGFVHRIFANPENKYHFNETVFMLINTMGVTQALNILTEGDLNPDMSISSFNFDLNSNLFRFNARGKVEKNKLILFTGVPESQEKAKFNLKTFLILPATFMTPLFIPTWGKMNSAVSTFSIPLHFPSNQSKLPDTPMKLFR